MGARRAPQTEAIMAELLAGLARWPGAWFTTEEAARLTMTRCYPCTEAGRPDVNCWQCRGVGRRPRMGWEVRRHLMHLLRDGLVLIEPAQASGTFHRWSANEEAVALDEHWRSLAAEAPA